MGGVYHIDLRKRSGGGGGGGEIKVFLPELKYCQHISDESHSTA